MPLRFVRGHHARHTPSAEVRARIAKANTGKKQSPEVLARLSIIRRGRKQSAETIRKRAASLTGKKRSEEFKAGARERNRNRSEAYRRNIAAAKTGDKNPQWRGGITQERVTSKAIKWARAVKQRDGYTCQTCGHHSKRGMEAHHVYSFAKYPEKRYDLENGVTLCGPCHWKLIKQREPNSLLDMCFGSTG